MIKNNLLGQVLIVSLIFFLLLSSVQMFGWGQSINPVEFGAESTATLPVMPVITNTKQATTESDRKQMLETIKTRPMFSINRQPPIELEEVPGENPGDDEPTPELKAQLTGVVITPEQSYAMILDTITNERETYKVGMPLEGEQGGWTLDSIQSRKVVFVSDDDKTEELELAVYSGGLKAGSVAKKGKNKSRSQDLTAKSDGKDSKDKKDSKKDKKKNADDIRKKIAERRAQMRADAAKKK